MKLINLYKSNLVIKFLIFLLLLPFMLIPNIVVLADSDPTNFEDWKQVSGSWASDSIGGGYTIKAAGCYVVSLAILGKRAGYDKVKVGGKEVNLTPGTFNQALKEQGVTSGGSMMPSNIGRVLSGTSLVNSVSVNGSTASKTIQGFHDSGYFTVVWTPYGSAGSHFMSVQKVDVSKNIIYVYDSSGIGGAGVTKVQSGGNDVLNISGISQVIAFKSGKKSFSDAPLLGGSSKDSDSTTDSSTTTSAKKEEVTKYNGSDAWKNKIINFKSTTYQSTFNGISTTSNGFLNNAIIAGLNNTSNRILNYSYVAMMYITTIVLLFMSISIVAYFVIFRNGVGGIKAVETFETITRIDMSKPDKTTITILFSRLLLSLVLITCLYANLVPLFMKGIVSTIQYFLNFF